MPEKQNLTQTFAFGKNELLSRRLLKKYILVIAVVEIFKWVIYLIQWKQRYCGKNTLHVYTLKCIIHIYFFFNMVASLFFNIFFCFLIYGIFTAKHKVVIIYKINRNILLIQIKWLLLILNDTKFYYAVNTFDEKYIMNLMTLQYLQSS